MRTQKRAKVSGVSSCELWRRVLGRENHSFRSSIMPPLSGPMNKPSQQISMKQTVWVCLLTYCLLLDHKGGGHTFLWSVAWISSKCAPLTQIQLLFTQWHSQSCNIPCRLERACVSDVGRGLFQSKDQPPLHVRLQVEGHAGSTSACFLLYAMQEELVKHEDSISSSFMLTAQVQRNPEIWGLNVFWVTKQCSLLVSYSEEGAVGSFEILSLTYKTIQTTVWPRYDHGMTMNSCFRWIRGSYSGATTCSSERVRRFEEAYRICLQGRRGSWDLLAACFMLVSCLLYYSTLIMAAIYSSETSFDFHQTIQRYIAEDITLQSYFRFCISSAISSLCIIFALWATIWGKRNIRTNGLSICYGMLLLTFENQFLSSMICSKPRIHVLTCC
jgi:hypothetical protein